MNDVEMWSVTQTAQNAPGGTAKKVGANLPRPLMRIGDVLKMPVLRQLELSHLNLALQLLGTWPSRGEAGAYA